MADIECGYPANTFLGTPGGKRHEPTIRCGRACAASKLGVPRLLRALLSSAAAADRIRPGSGIRERSKSQLHSVARGARRGITIRRHHSATRMDRGRRYVQNAREELF